MIAYGTDEYGNITNREAQKEPEQVGGGYVCNEKESFLNPPDCPADKRLTVINGGWSVIDIDSKHIRDGEGIRSKTQIELYETGVEEIPKGYKIVDKELQPKTLEEQLTDKEITQEVYNQIKNQPVIYDLQNIDIKSIRALREWLNKQPDCPEFLKQYEKEASDKRSILVK